MAEPLYLALDQGGHSSRALVFDASGRCISSARLEVSSHSPHPGWVEQPAAALAGSLRDACAQVRVKLGRRWNAVRAAGLATQRSNCLCWERADGRALSAVLSWQDRRAQSWLESRQLDPDWVRVRTGLYPSAHYGAGKLRWCLDHLPAVQAADVAGQLVCGPLAGYLRRTLTGEPDDLVDPANASRTLLWSLATRDWDPDLLSAFGIDSSLLPRCVPSRFAFGDVAGVPLTLLTGDQSAAFYADGQPRHETLYINLGTGAFLQRLWPDSIDLPEGLLGSVVYADADRTVQVLEATVNGAGTAFDWARDQLGIQDIEVSLPGWLEKAGEIPLFINGIAGVGSPWWRAQLPSRFIGPGEPWAQAVAVAESVVFLIMTNLALLDGDRPVSSIQVSGGLAQLDGLCQRLANLAQRPVSRRQQPEATARGLVWLMREETEAPWHEEPVTSFEPAPDSALEARYARWSEHMRQALGEPG